MVRGRKSVNPVCDCGHKNYRHKRKNAYGRCYTCACMRYNEVVKMEDVKNEN